MDRYGAAMHDALGLFEHRVRELGGGRASLLEDLADQLAADRPQGQITQQFDAKRDPVVVGHRLAAQELADDPELLAPEELDRIFDDFRDVLDDVHEFGRTRLDVMPYILEHVADGPGQDCVHRAVQQADEPEILGTLGLCAWAWRLLVALDQIGKRPVAFARGCVTTCREATTTLPPAGH